MAIDLGAFRLIVETEWAENIERGIDAAMERSCKIVQARAKGLIGHEQPEWPPLDESTIAEKQRLGYPVPAPLLRTGEMRDSIQWEAPEHDGDDTVGWVGSNNEKAVYHELGTSRIPPRPFLLLAALRSEAQFRELMGDAAFRALLPGALARLGYELEELTEELVGETSTSHESSEDGAAKADRLIDSFFHFLGSPI